MIHTLIKFHMMKSMFMFLLIFLLTYFVYSDFDSTVKFLPGFDGPLPFQLQTGYIGVGKEQEIQLFYYLIKSEKNPQEDPILLWISGGPYCSSISGLLFENGPLTFKDKNINGSIPSLISTTYSWTKISNIIYLDQPVGTGFSYSKTPIKDVPSDSGEIKRISEFILKWFSKHTEFVSNPFYVAGNSYSGLIIPAIVQEISKGNEFGFKPQINLQGYVLGNPGTDEKFDANQQIPFAHGMSLISDELYELLKRSCKGNYLNVDQSNTECLKFVKEFQKSFDRIYKAHILLPCGNKPTKNVTRKYDKRRFLSSNSLLPPNDCLNVYPELLTSNWANDKTVRKALHVRKGSKGKWKRCYWYKPYNFDMKSAIPYHINNSIKSYRSLIFSGDHDLYVPFLGTQKWIKSLNYSIVQKWRPWMINDQIAGYTIVYANNMTYVTVKGGGHTPEYKPEESYIMFKRWLSGKPL